MRQYLHRLGTRSYYEDFDYHTLPVVLACFPAEELKDFQVVMCTQPKLSPEKMLATFGRTPDFLSSGSFFAASTGESIFNLISNGVTYSTTDDPVCKLGVGKLWEADAPDLGPIRNGAEDWSDYLTAYPLLVLDGGLQDVSDYRDIDYAAQRMVFGKYTTEEDEEWYFFLLVEGNGCRLGTLQDIILYIFDDDKTVDWAANLDGGGSAYLAVEGKRVSEGEQGGWLRAIDNVIAVYLKDVEPEDEEPEEEPEVKKYWRVSMGAFSVEENARKYLEVVRGVGTGLVDYGKAFLSYDEERQLYRVQVGAFSKREGALRVAEELNNLGYDTYVRYGI